MYEKEYGSYKESVVEFDYKDVTSRGYCCAKKRDVVDLVHAHLGLVSAVKITHVPEKEALKLETGRGSIFVTCDLSKVLT